ncbi:unnamed protein product [Vitrella brassicaformis CCMP3155]|uniref:Endonuclease/exonuclease/phosphatase domain-containing protein n=2 Tax=Vitrella brassicaformis TaxID=1169539 RepID=A0A0G4EN25_VITBC|nr:unnamed protein product [Vitrella brassicaformis CCMP3155]|eukprot:CEL98428.1 unnamed protein product [Vitrella brassicaformis CCMP3155]
MNALDAFLGLLLHIWGLLLTLLLTVLQPLIKLVIRACCRRDAFGDARDGLTSHLNCRTTISSRDAPAAAEKDNPTCTFVCASYNILAPCYVKCVDFPYCSRKAISPERRFERVVAEVKSLGADVVGFQETQREVLDQHLRSELNEIGYGELFFDSKTLGKGAQFPEGLLTAVRSDRFTVEHKTTVKLDERVKKAVRGMAGSRVTEADIDGLALPGGNVGQVLLLRCRTSGRLLLFANVHIHYFWLRPDRQCLQISEMIEAIAELGAQWGADLQKETPVCFVGHFAIVPHIGSRTNLGYSILSRGKIDLQGDSTHVLKRTPLFDLLIRKAKMGGEEVADKMQPSHSIGLTSVYAHIMGREPTFTNHVGPSFADCLDYIWVSDLLRPISCLGMPPASSIWQYVGAPNVECPSHFSLRAELAFV